MILVIPDEDQLEKEIAFDWVISTFDAKEIKIKLNFEDPDIVSSGGYPDIL